MQVAQHSTTVSFDDAAVERLEHEYSQMRDYWVETTQEIAKTITFLESCPGSHWLVKEFLKADLRQFMESFGTAEELGLQIFKKEFEQRQGRVVKALARIRENWRDPLNESAVKALSKLPQGLDDYCVIGQWHDAMVDPTGQVLRIPFNDSTNPELLEGNLKIPLKDANQRFVEAFSVSTELVRKGKGYYEFNTAYVIFLEMKKD